MKRLMYQLQDEGIWRCTIAILPHVYVLLVRMCLILFSIVELSGDVTGEKKSTTN